MKGIREKKRGREKERKVNMQLFILRDSKVILFSIYTQHRIYLKSKFNLSMHALQVGPSYFKELPNRHLTFPGVMETWKQKPAYICPPVILGQLHLPNVVKESYPFPPTRLLETSSVLGRHVYVCYTVLKCQQEKNCVTKFPFIDQFK